MGIPAACGFKPAGHAWHHGFPLSPQAAIEGPNTAQCRLTYAQNPCCGAPSDACQGNCCYKTNSDRK